MSRLFDTTTNCAKCGASDWSGPRYHSYGTREDGGFISFTCGVCGYWVSVPPLDHPKRKKGEG